MKLTAIYTPELSDPNSEAFKNLAMALEASLMAVFRASNPYIAEIQIMSFKPGSVVAVYRIIVDNNAPEDAIDASQIMAEISSAIKSGALSALKVDPSFPIVAKVSDIDKVIKGNTLLL